MNQPLFIGYCTIDSIEGKEYLGGAAGASALNAASLGYSPHLVSVLSSDIRGQRYQQKLIESGVDISRCILNSSSIPTCIISDLHGTGSTRIWNDNGTIQTLEKNKILLHPLHDISSIFLYSSHPTFQHAIIQTPDLPPVVYVPGPQIVTKPQYLSLGILKKTTLLFVNKEESEVLSPQIALSHGVSVVVVTTGKDGGVIHTNKGTSIPFTSPNVVVTDTTGAGDGFALGFALSYFEDSDISKAIEKGIDIVKRVVVVHGSTFSL